MGKHEKSFMWKNLLASAHCKSLLKLLDPNLLPKPTQNQSEALSCSDPCQPGDVSGVLKTKCLRNTQPFL